MENENKLWFLSERKAACWRKRLGCVSISKQQCHEGVLSCNPEFHVYGATIRSFESRRLAQLNATNSSFSSFMPLGLGSRSRKRRHLARTTAREPGLFLFSVERVQLSPGLLVISLTINLRTRSFSSSLGKRPARKPSVF
jgi:hypothetical protein